MQNPLFMPTYMAVQDGFDVAEEYVFDGLEIFDPQFLRKLPDDKWAKLLNVLIVGNDKQVDFTNTELLNDFKLDEQTIKAYRNIRDMYNYGLSHEVAKRKAFATEIEMTPAEEAAIEKNILEHIVARRGYTSTTRLGKKWAVYQPPPLGEEARKYFTIVDSKHDAQEIAKALGPGAEIYPRLELGERIFRHLTVSDLDNLIESADVDMSDPSVATLRKELIKKTFSAHWLKRQNDPGYLWNKENVIESALDYLDGAARGRARAEAKVNAYKVFRETSKDMSPSLKAYTEQYLNGIYNTGSMGWKQLGRFIYHWQLAFKLSVGAQNTTQPLATTYPAVAEYYKGLDVEKAFIGAEAKAVRYCMSKIAGVKHGLSSSLVDYLEKMHRQGIFGDQMYRFMVGARTVRGYEVDRFLSSIMRGTEFHNKAQAAIVAHDIATNVLKLTDPNSILAFGKKFVYATQWAYGKQNLPLLINEAGAVRGFFRLAYMYRHHVANYAHFLFQRLPGKVPKGEWMRAYGAAFALAGVTGAFGYALFDYGWKKLRKRTFEQDWRGAMKRKGIPIGIVDLSLHGAFTTLGIDASSLVGYGDIVRPEEGVAGNIFGGGFGFFESLGKSAWLLSRGEIQRAVETSSPGALRGILRSYRYLKDGLRKLSGELLGTPSKMDAAKTAMGFTPLSVSKMYAKEEAKRTMVQARRDLSSKYNERLSKSIFKGDTEGRRKVLADINRRNKDASRENRIEIDWDAVYNRVREMRGRDVGVPSRLKRHFRELEEVFK